MDLEFVLLALLSHGPATGYDLKKRIATSESLHWSGNSNQVYRPLIELHRAGLTALATERSASGPERKVYSLTEAGRAALREWLVGELEPASGRFTLIERLLGAPLLDDDELLNVLHRYAETLRLRLAALEELERRALAAPVEMPARQQAIEAAILHRPVAFIRDELTWLQELQGNLLRLRREREAARG